MTLFDPEETQPEGERFHPLTGDPLPPIIHDTFRSGYVRCPTCEGTGYVAPLPDPEVDAPGKVQRDGMDTARLAALRAMPNTGTQRGLILTAIREHHPGGLIDEEIGNLPGVANTAHRTRRNELVEGGWIEDTKRTRPTEASGSPSELWGLTLRACAKFGLAYVLPGKRT